MEPAFRTPVVPWPWIAPFGGMLLAGYLLGAHSSLATLSAGSASHGYSMGRAGQLTLLVSMLASIAVACVPMESTSGLRILVPLLVGVGLLTIVVAYFGAISAANAASNNLGGTVMTSETSWTGTVWLSGLLQIGALATAIVGTVQPKVLARRGVSEASHAYRP